MEKFKVGDTVIFNPPKDNLEEFEPQWAARVGKRLKIIEKYDAKLWWGVFEGEEGYKKYLFASNSLKLINLGHHLTDIFK